MNICVIGTGYVGLVTGSVFADLGNEVLCVDKDEAKIQGLHQGKMPIWEPGLESLVKANAERKRLTFTTSLPDGVKNAEAVFIAVGTPSRRGDGQLSQGAPRFDRDPTRNRRYRDRAAGASRCGPRHGG